MIQPVCTSPSFYGKIRDTRILEKVIEEIPIAQARTFQRLRNEVEKIEDNKVYDIYKEIVYKSNSASNLGEKLVYIGLKDASKKSKQKTKISICIYEHTVNGKTEKKHKQAFIDGVIKPLEKIYK